MTSKERAALRAQANTIDTTLMVGKGGVSETLVAEAQKLLDKFTKSLDAILDNKEKEIMTV